MWKVLRDIEPYLNGRGTYPKTSGEVNALFEKGAIDMHLSYDISESPARHGSGNRHTNGVGAGFMNPASRRHVRCTPRRTRMGE